MGQLAGEKKKEKKNESLRSISRWMKDGESCNFHTGHSLVLHTVAEGEEGRDSR